MMEPKIRFKGFEGEWKASIIGDFCSVSIGEFVIKTKQNDNAPYPVYNGGSSYTGFYENYNQEGPKVIVSARGANAGFVNYCKKNFWAGNSCYSIATKDNRNLKFLYHCLKKNQSTYLNNQQAANIPSISKKDIQETILMMPKSFEQQAIASYFTSLDSQISASTSRLASLKQMKAASLQAMFPQEGETVPKIRFKGFEGEWKKVMFSETFEFLKNNSLSRAELSNEGDIVNVHYGDVLIKYGDLLNIQNEELTFIADNKIGNTLYNSCHLQNGDIIIADAAEDNTVGKCSEIVNICNKRVVSGLHTIPCRPLNRFAQGYLGHYINSESYHNQLLPLIQGSKISSISKKTLSQTIVLVPSIEEQKCIGNYFTSLDRQISLQSQRLEKLKQIKSACLDKMFV